MRAEYIDREAAITAMWKALYEYEDKTEKQFKEEPELDLYDWFIHRIFVQATHAIMQRTIQDAPAADVAPVKRGKWVRGNWHIRCSECGEDYPFMTPNYCPNCGARNEGVE